MKTMLTVAILFSSFTASAATYVNSNIFTASGPATSNYGANLRKIQRALSPYTKAEMGLMSFNGALVDANNNTIRYDFHRFETEQSNNNQTCWSRVSFLVTNTEAGPVVSDVKAGLDCTLVND